MNILFVVSQQQDWPSDIPGVTVIPAQTYLLDPAYGDIGSTKVFNLCRTYRYQSEGYYVSLLAEARGHQPVPDVQVMKDLYAGGVVQDITEKLGNLIDCSFALTPGDVADLDIYFGRDARGEHPHLCEQLFNYLRTPVLHVRFEKANGAWHLCSVYPGSIRDIPAHHQEYAALAAMDYLKGQKIRSSTPASSKPTLAILHDPQRNESPSNAAALRKFVEAAELLGMGAELITPKECGRIASFDALFIRDTTRVDHYTYELSRQAADNGMMVIDDPESILRCTNKIYLNELLNRHHVPTPKTLVVHKGNVDQIVATLGLPCILKQPDGAFSQGVVKIESEDTLLDKVSELLKESELVLAQEYLPTDFDWRIGVLDQRPLFVCKYYMAPGHWQIIKHEHHRTSEGRTEALSVGEAPDEVVKIAVQAANLIGDGFYGVDIKQVGCQYYVIEINDNPNVDAGNEDAVLSDALYREVMGVFRKRIDARKGNTSL
ncbi:RimK family protein [Noviherbaspirillum denitrificans]|uniref:Glutathione synthase n=1 Tax=Noviherbaspirillum denitrificans TaxID=1968433 RepID=A0A254TK83_9BURK|nr:RimK family protein [Noviherbaspirillum denitrificans]OWW21013.1 glutathione synthase [Noviherbaspirillum denitrificans]